MMTGYGRLIDQFNADEIIIFPFIFFQPVSFIAEHRNPEP